MKKCMHGIDLEKHVCVDCETIPSINNSTLNDGLHVTVYDGKYTVIQDETGRLRALRYGEEWRDCCGDGLILALAQEIANLREKNA